jgi:hypothetical protein
MLFVEIRDVVELVPKAGALALLAAGVEGKGEAAELQAEGDLLVVAELLVVEDDDRVSRQRPLDLAERRGIDAAAQIDVSNLGKERGRQRIDRNRHGRGVLSAIT